MPIGAFRLNTLSAALAQANSITATGGTIDYYKSGSTSYKIHTFNTSGTQSFIVSSVSGSSVIDALIIGAGGGGGSGGGLTGSYGGGGGGGQVQTITNYSITPQTYSLTIGIGGSSTLSTTTRGGTGGSTVAFGTTSVGGGGGGSIAQTSTATSTGGAGGAAGGGGAAGCANSVNTARSGGTGTQAGGTGYDFSNSPYGHAGGGGSNANAGGNATSSTHGAGGTGPTSSITGTSIVYASGGVGGTGTNNTTIGGGGAGANATSDAGNAGAVIIRYPYLGDYYQFISSATSGVALAVPTVQDGDIAIYFQIATAATTAPGAVTPSGWTNVVNSSANGIASIRMMAHYKIMTAAESGTTLTDMASSIRRTFIIYRPSRSYTISTTSVNQQVSNSATTLTNQTLTMGSQSKPYIGFTGYYSGGSSITFGSTTTSSRNIQQGANAYSRLFESSDTTINYSNSTISITASTSQMALCSFRIDLT
jgi:hypothetical protein